MKNRGLLIVLLLVVLGLVTGAVFWMAEGGGPADGGDDAADVVPNDGDDTTSTDGAPAADDAAAADSGRRKRRRAASAWVNKGHGSLVGKLLEYGTDAPVAGVAVKLIGDADGPDRTLETVSGEDGTFVFDGVPEYEAWALVAEAQAPLSPAEVGGVEVLAHQQNDAGVIYLSPGFVVLGSVVDPDGAPIAGAQVRAVRASTTGAMTDILKLVRNIPRALPAVDEAETNAKGQFRLTKTPPGSYDVFVSAKGRQLRVRRGVIVNPDNAGNGLRFVLPEGYGLKGRVVREGGGPVDGLQVVAFPQPRGPQGFATLQEKHFAETGPQGDFAFDGLAAASYIFAVSPENEPTTMTDDQRVPGTEFVELRLDGQAWIEGRVTDSEKQPVEGAEVFLIIEGRGNAPTFASQLTDPDGRYRLDGLPLQKVQGFVVRKEGYASYPTDPQEIFRNRGGFQLEKGRNEKSVELVAGGTIRGTVVGGEGGEPLGGVKVQLVSMTSMLTGQKSTTTADDGSFELTGVPQGTAFLSIAKEGWNQVDDPLANPQALMGGFRPGGGEDTADPGEGAQVVIAEPGSVVERTLRMESGLSVSGRVVGPDGKPVVGAQVALESPGSGGGMGRMMAAFMSRATPRLTDSDGRFVLPGARPGQPTTVVVKAAGYMDGSSDPVTPTSDGKPADVEVRLQRGATIQGVVRSSEGKPIAGAQVSWRPKQSGGPQFDFGDFGGREPAFSDQSGRYRIENAAIGGVVLAVTHGDFVDVDDIDLETKEAETVDKDVQLATGETIAGRVLGPDDRPISGARVNIHATEFAAWQSARTEPDGTFRFSGLKAGKYQINASSNDHTSASLKDFETGSAEAVLRLEKALTIRGIVQYADGSPAANAQVTANAEGRTGSGSSTANDGTFEIDSLASGTYTLEVSPGWGADERPNLIGTRVTGIVAGTSGVAIQVERGLVVRGTVRHADGRKPEDGWVNGQPITADGQHDGARGNVNLQGTVREGKLYVGGLSPGRYRLNVRIGAQNRSIDVEAGDENVRIELGPTGAAAGRVLVPSGVQLANISVYVSGGDGSSWAQAGKDGAYRMEGLPVGRYTVHVSANSRDGTAYAGQYEGVDVVADGVATVPDIALSEVARESTEK